ncbi:MAG: type II secretion system F family protein [Candidatus Woesearchaeota archaeon]
MKKKIVVKKMKSTRRKIIPRSVSKPIAKFSSKTSIVQNPKAISSGNSPINNNSGNVKNMPVNHSMTIFPSNEDKTVNLNVKNVNSTNTISNTNTLPHTTIQQSSSNSLNDKKIMQEDSLAPKKLVLDEHNTENHEPPAKLTTMQKILTDKDSYKFSADDVIKKLFVKEEKKKKVDVQEKTYLRKILRQAGYDAEPEILKSKILTYSIFAVIAASVILLIYGAIIGVFLRMAIPLLILWILALPLIIMLVWGVVFMFLDYKKYTRKKELEEVWPEYLQLVVSNINAGMLIDVALWSAVKPKYKVLAREIEEVAKQTLTGKDLSDALTDFADKYDSVMVQRTVSLLIEGMESGGKIAILLNKISLDIQDTKIMRKEMSASVMTYAIFITFATVVAAPFLFGLSTQLLTIIQDIIGKVGQTSSSSSMFTFSSDGVKISDFKIFAYVMLGITSLMSACLIGTIRRGSVKDGLKFIPLFMAGTLIIYYLSTIILGSLFSGLI